MCGRFTLTRSARDLASHFELDEIPELAPRFNVAPGQPVASVTAEPDGGRRLALRRWGLIPRWAKDPAIGNRLINARCETVASKPAFRDAFARRRCLVPTDGFYEWSGSGPRRRPTWFRMRGEGPAAFAGLWERWRDVEGEWLESCTVLTTEANALVRAVHHRMPVILEPSAYARWLSPALPDADSLAPLLAPCPEDWLEAMEVGTYVNDPRHDDAGCLEPAEPAEPELPFDV